MLDFSAPRIRDPQERQMGFFKRHPSNKIPGVIIELASSTSFYMYIVTGIDENFSLLKTAKKCHSQSIPLTFL